MKKLLFLSLILSGASFLHGMEGPAKDEENSPQKSELELLSSFLNLCYYTDDVDQEGKPMCVKPNRYLQEILPAYLKDIFGSKKTLFCEQSVTINDRFFLDKMIFMTNFKTKSAEENLFRMLYIKELIIQNTVATYELLDSAPRETSTGAHHCIPIYQSIGAQASIDNYFDVQSELNKLDKPKKSDSEVEQIILINKIVSRIKNAVSDGKDVFSDKKTRYRFVEEKEQQLFNSLPIGIQSALSTFVSFQKFLS